MKQKIIEHLLKLKSTTEYDDLGIDLDTILLAHSIPDFWRGYIMRYYDEQSGILEGVVLLEEVISFIRDLSFE